jgi:cell division septal protein FtsQ
VKPGQRRVQRSGARPSFGQSRPSYSRRSTVRSQPQRRRPRRPSLGLPSVRLPAFPLIKAAWLKLAVITTVILILLVVLAHLTTLRQLKVEGNRSVSTAQVVQLADTGLRHQWFGRNTILIDGGALASYLEQADPAIAQVTVSRSSFHAVTIKIAERQPTINWKTGGVVYLLDANATVISPTTGSYASLPTVTDSSNLPVKAGDRVAPTQFVTFCADLARLLPGTGYQVSAMTVPASTSELYVTTTTGLTLKFDTTRSAAGEINDLKAVQAELKAANKTPTQYIDLRIPNKAYYM